MDTQDDSNLEEKTKEEVQKAEEAEILFDKLVQKDPYNNEQFDTPLPTKELNNLMAFEQHQPTTWITNAKRKAVNMLKNIGIGLYNGTIVEARNGRIPILDTAWRAAYFKLLHKEERKRQADLMTIDNGYIPFKVLKKGGNRKSQKTKKSRKNRKKYKRTSRR